MIVSIPDTINHQALERNLFLKKTYGEVLYLKLKAIIARERLLIFKPYPFIIGQKLNIGGGPRNGDWEVIGVSDRKVKLRCPVSSREFEWNRFCYFAEERSGVVWPQGKE